MQPDKRRIVVFGFFILILYVSLHPFDIRRLRRNNRLLTFFKSNRYAFDRFNTLVVK